MAKGSRQLKLGGLTLGLAVMLMAGGAVFQLSQSMAASKSIDRPEEQVIPIALEQGRHSLKVCQREDVRPKAGRVEILIFMKASDPIGGGDFRAMQVHFSTSEGTREHSVVPSSRNQS